jgi:hypothetical protein
MTRTLVAQLTRTLVVLCMLPIATGCPYLQQHYPEYFQQKTVSRTLPQTWTRVDGQPVDAAQLEVDKTVCRGKMDEANAALGNDARLNPEIWGYTEGMISVYSSCMAQNGYTAN